MTTLQLVTLITAIVGAVCGILGAVLGIVNTWHQRSQTRVKLRVIPKLAWMLDGENVLTARRRAGNLDDLISGLPHNRLCIDVMNLSAFAVTVSEVGFGRVDKVRCRLFKPELSPGKTWPVRLEPRESFTAYALPGMTLDEHAMRYAVAYAQTDCDTVAYGTSPIFKDFIRKLRRHSEARQ